MTMHIHNNQQFLFYDLETWGLLPQSARIVEFAAIRVNAQLEQIESPITLVCKLSPECVPDPDAVRIHGKTPQWTIQHGQSEYQCASIIHDHFNKANTCLIGYNNVRFDDNVVRFLLYRNMFDPYTHQWKNNNSRWDVLDLVRLAYALRPNTLTWADDSLRLADLAYSNNLVHTQAHNALHDVEATLALAKHIRNNNPKMFQYAFGITRGHRLTQQVNSYLKKACLHISPRFLRRNGHLGIVYPVCHNPTNRKQLLAVVLNYATDMLHQASVDEIREHIFTKDTEISHTNDKLRLKIIHLNRAPLLLPLSLLDDARAQELNIDIPESLARYQRLQGIPNLAKIMQQVLVEDNPYTFSTQYCSQDPEQALYQNFIPHQDRQTCQIVHAHHPDQWGKLQPKWQDQRMHSLWLRLKGREVPHTLNAHERSQWQAYVYTCLNGQMDHLPSVEGALVRCTQLLADNPANQPLHELYTFLQDMRNY